MIIEPPQAPQRDIALENYNSNPFPPTENALPPGQIEQKDSIKDLCRTTAAEKLAQHRKQDNAAIFEKKRKATQRKSEQTPQENLITANPSATSPKNPEAEKKNHEASNPTSKTPPIFKPNPAVTKKAIKKSTKTCNLTQQPWTSGHQKNYLSRPRLEQQPRQKTGKYPQQ